MDVERAKVIRKIQRRYRELTQTWTENGMFFTDTKNGYHPEVSEAYCEDVPALIALLHTLSTANAELERNTIRAFLGRQMPWSSETFGTGPRVGGIIRHIEKELDEIRQAPTDLSEWMDVVILALDGAWRAGYHAEQIEAALFAKQDKNMAREWPPPTDDDTPNEHVRQHRGEGE